MRIRDLEARLLRLGWTRERAILPQVRWRSPRGRLLTYHAPHGTAAAEVPKAMERQVLRKIEVLGEREAS